MSNLATAPRALASARSSNVSRISWAAWSTDGSAHSEPARYGPLSSASSTSSYWTAKLFDSVMKSVLPDQPVAITGLPRAMASAMVSPRPSERCSETYTSHAAIKSSSSSRVQKPVSSETVWPLAASSMAWYTSGAIDSLVHLMTRLAPSLGAKACLKARIAASGFLRWTLLAKSKTNAYTTSVSSTPRRSRPCDREPSRSGTMTGGTCTTGIGEMGVSALATKELVAQISSYSAKRSYHSSGNSGSSQNQTPML